MDAEYFVVDNSREREVVEDFSAVAPDIHRAVLSEAFIIETVDLCDLSTLVVASNKRDSFWVSHLQKIIISRSL